MLQRNSDLTAYSAANVRNDQPDEFFQGDCADVLSRLANRLEGEWQAGEGFKADIQQVEAKAQQALRDQVGAYAALSDAVHQALPETGLFVLILTSLAVPGAADCCRPKNRLAIFIHSRGPLG